MEQQQFMKQEWTKFIWVTVGGIAALILVLLWEYLPCIQFLKGPCFFHEVSMNINNLDNDIKKYKQQVALGEALERLEVNPDFRMLIELNYLGTHALDLVYSRTRDMTPDNEIARKIDAVATFKQYLDEVKDNRATATKSLREAEQTREEFYDED